MILVGQTVPYRNTCIFCKLFHNFLSKAAVLDTIVDTAKYACGIRDALLLADLGAGRLQICSAHIMRCNLKGASGAGAGLLKNQGHVFASVVIDRNAFFFLTFHLCGKIQEIQDFLRSVVLQCQKMSSL